MAQYYTLLELFKGKVFEQIIHNQLTKHLEENKLLPNF